MQRMRKAKAKKPKSPEAKKPKSQEAKKPRSQEAKKPKSQEAKKPKNKSEKNNNKSQNKYPSEFFGAIDDPAAVVDVSSILGSLCCRRQRNTSSPSWCRVVCEMLLDQTTHDYSWIPVWVVVSYREPYM